MRPRPVPFVIVRKKWPIDVAYSDLECPLLRGVRPYNGVAAGHIVRSRST